MTKNRLLNNIMLNSLSINTDIVKKLSHAGLKNLQDLLLCLPIRYEDRSKIYSIKNAFKGMKVSIKGKIMSKKIIFGRRKILTVTISDGRENLSLYFFNFYRTLKNIFSTGKYIIVYGTVIYSDQHGKGMIHPEFSIINDQNQIKLSKFLTPIYSNILGIGRNKLFINLISQALDQLQVNPLKELLPPELNKNLVDLNHALWILHRPSVKNSPIDLMFRDHPARYRLIFEELLSYYLNLLMIKKEIKNKKAFPIYVNYTLFDRFLAFLPFSLTKAQFRVIEEIIKDLKRHEPMVRMVQGDVGSGKTLIAASAALFVAAYGGQVALMVPTELLAEQHTKNFQKWFSPFGITVELVSSCRNKTFQTIQQNSIKNGKILVIIGTHAIFQKKVCFSKLLLIIIDEQHRFGVNQRFSFWKKGISGEYYPHQLFLTATPIPRTLFMMTYSNLDISIIDESPLKKTSVITVVIPDSKRTDIIHRIFRSCVHEHRQVYWICTVVKKSSSKSEIQGAESTWKQLKNMLPDIKIGLIHGRMESSEKRSIMESFKNGILQILVSTTVIEVGIDVPNASLMIIENSERLGLAQLHQLRGRIGRGKMTSYCVLLYKSPLNKYAKERLKIIRNSNNGFLIAKKDLEMRGTGDIYGTHQTGYSEFYIANLVLDQKILPKAYHAAQYIYQYYPDSVYNLINRWKKRYQYNIIP